jgi:hypothetical protein
MKTFTLIALAGCASAAELTGYTIDLCPDAIGTKSLGDSIYLPGNEEALILGNLWAQERVANQAARDEFAVASKIEQFNKMAAMKNLYSLGREQNVILPTGGYRVSMEEKMIFPGTTMGGNVVLGGSQDARTTLGTQFANLVGASDMEDRLAGEIVRELAARELEANLGAQMYARGLAGADFEENLGAIYARGLGTSDFETNLGASIIAQKLGAFAPVGKQVFDYTPGMVEESVPGAFENVKERIAMVPGSDFGGSYFTLGSSYSPDSFSLGDQADYLGCVGQEVLVYPERNPEVLWCGERNLQGNQTLKRTNIHHNYVHDINQLHNYHNRTKHSARQFDTVEKDCSCKGVAVEAQYSCPPGIEAPTAVGTMPVGVSLITRPMAAIDSPYILGAKKSCGCE